MLHRPHIGRLLRHPAVALPEAVVGTVATLALVNRLLGVLLAS